MKKYRTREDLVQAYIEGEVEIGSTYDQRMFFECGVIYSYGYHFPIAKEIYRPDFNSSFYLFTNEKYSNSTAKHKNHVYRGLCYHKKEIVHCEAIPRAIASFDYESLYQNLILSIEKAVRRGSKKTIKDSTTENKRRKLYAVYQTMHKLAKSFPTENIKFITGMFHLRDICLPR